MRGWWLLQGVLDGIYDDLPEMAFYMVGDIEEVQAKADKLAKEAAARKEADTSGKDSRAADMKDLPSLEKVGVGVGGGWGGDSRRRKRDRNSTVK